MHSFLARTTSFHPKLLKSAMNVHHIFITTHSWLEFYDNVYNFVQSNAIKRNIYHEFEGELLVFLGGEKFQKFQKVSLYRESQHIIPPSCHKCYKYTFLPSVKVIIKQTKDLFVDIYTDCLQIFTFYIKTFNLNGLYYSRKTALCMAVFIRFCPVDNLRSTMFVWGLNNLGTLGPNSKFCLFVVFYPEYQ